MPAFCDHVTQTGSAHQRDHFAGKATKTRFLPSVAQAVWLGSIKWMHADSSRERHAFPSQVDNVQLLIGYVIHNIYV